ncbi:hypothetical protein ACFQ5D_17915 [Paenibacillus farraposensis]|uniref:Uncharacterized protein n=1 Tax=Paenibacillus farraposensis TaxID=2807095 RepID=A0ABW4DJZ0_9BACL|nr:hypothetical protein [Paenibacillus farraposensis]MCC3381908.1 hypothetical protein [Paenibacillus farraposensis]
MGNGLKSSDVLSRQETLDILKKVIGFEDEGASKVEWHFKVSEKGKLIIEKEFSPEQAEAITVKLAETFGVFPDGINTFNVLLDESDIPYVEQKALLLSESGRAQ